MRFAIGFALVWSSAAALAMPPLPRKAPEFTITEPSGKETLLSSYRGKVVVLAFVHTTCPHCQAFSMILENLYKELGPKGFQPIDVAWNPNAQQLAPMFAKALNLTFPVGYSSYDPIMDFMGFSLMDRPVVPLEVVIDRQGMIRAESPPGGDPNLQDQGKLRALIESLLSAKTSAKR
ncbi:MAG TPA: TlpA disulfide reductase family protein [Bryobacteraceae bacterium]|jgi:peroxiredoxin|nr:TlpA disulfide reductase family protein [Bryobacteraceae bacterium]